MHNVLNSNVLGVTSVVIGVGAIVYLLVKGKQPKSKEELDEIKLDELKNFNELP